MKWATTAVMVSEEKKKDMKQLHSGLQKKHIHP